MKKRFGDLLIALCVGLAVYVGLFAYRDILPEISILYLAFALMACCIMVIGAAIFLLVRNGRLSEALPVDRKSVLLAVCGPPGVYLLYRTVGIELIHNPTEQEMAIFIIACLIFMVILMALSVVRVLNEPPTEPST